MVSIAAIAGMAVTTIVSIGLPVAIYLVLRRRLVLKFIPALVGAATFVVMALILEPLLHQLVLRPAADGSVALRDNNPVLFALYAIFAAGIFEETGRFVAFKLLRNRYQGVRTAVSYGIGHGGIESILLVGLTMITNLALALAINAGLAADLPAIVSQSLTQTDAGIFYLGGAERVLAIVTQLALSVLVWVAATQPGKWWLFPVAIATHALFDLPAVLYQLNVLDIVVTELLLACLAAALAVIGWRVVAAHLAAEKTASAA
ncbi:MAG: YhfC family intramembrane metalloprotease [Propionibacteriaceae bacterium]|jgi:uncharacterized membrane protein YhfC|nr:YhfC family intramembrane metalloprotease [Propionibacteriaceae bacterium]